MYIEYNIKSKWNSPVNNQTSKIPLLDSYSFHLTCPTHRRPYWLTSNHLPNTLQWHLLISLPNLSLDKSIQDFVTDSSISRNTFIQSGFSYYDYFGKFPKILKTFATSDMDDHKDISSGNSINFDESTKYMLIAVVVGRDKPHQPTSLP